MGSKLVFRSSLGPWAVLTCACGCGESVVVWDDQASQAPGPTRFYKRHHQPLGCDPVRVCEPWEQEYDLGLDFKRELTPFEEEDTPTIEWPDALEQPDSVDDLLFDSDYDTRPT